MIILSTSAEQADLLIRSLRLDRMSERWFVGPVAERNLPRLFGGQVLAQALMAAGTTTPDDRRVHSLHAHFLVGGDPTRPVSYLVDVLRDGRTYSARTVTARQDERDLAVVTLSFQAAEDGPEHEDVDPGDVPAPDVLAPLHDQLAPYLDRLPPWWREPHPFDLRFVRPPDALAAGLGGEPRQQFWFRAATRLPDEPLLHSALLAYASDLTLLDPALMPHKRSWYGNRIVNGASIDHALWFHRPCRVDEWLLCSQVSPIAAGGRCFCTCSVTNGAGTLVGSAAQEGVLREPGP